MGGEEMGMTVIMIGCVNRKLHNEVSLLLML